MNIEHDKYVININFDDSSHEVRVKVSNSSLLKKDALGAPFSLASPDEVRESIDKIKNYLSAYNIIEKDMNRILERLKEFKYISPRSCDALHFKFEERVEESENRIEELLGEIVKIRNFSLEEDAPVRSIVVDTFHVSDSENIQLRMVLGEDGRFISFSFAQENESMDNYKWYAKGSSIYLKDKRGDVILSLDLENFNYKNNDDGGLILAKLYKDDGIENEQRSYIRLRRKNKDQWEIDKYNTQHLKSNVSKDGVFLSSSFAKHRAVIQVNGKDVFFPKFEDKKIMERFSSVLPADSIDESERAYNECMSERTRLLQEQKSFGHSDLDINEKDNINFCEKMALLNQKDHRKNLSFRSCLMESDILLSQERFEYLNYGYLSSIDDDEFKKILLNCQVNQKITQIKKKIIRLAQSNNLAWTRDETTSFEKGIENCMKNGDEHRCANWGERLIEMDTMFVFLSSISKKMIECSNDKAFEEEYYKEKEECYLEHVNSALESYDLDFIRSGLHSIGQSLSRDINISSNQNAVKSFRQCFGAELDKENSLLEKKDKWYQIEQYCLTQSLKDSIKENLTFHAKEQIHNLLDWVNNETLIRVVEEQVNLEIYSKVDEWSSISSYGEMKNLVVDNIYAIVASHFFYSKIKEKKSRKFEKMMNKFLLTGASKKSLNGGASHLSVDNMKARVVSQLSLVERDNRPGYIKKLIKISELNSIEIEDSSSNALLVNNEVAHERVSPEYINCLNDVSVAQNRRFSNEMKKCAISYHQNLLLENSRIEFENLISSHFIVTSSVASRLSEKISQLKQCLAKYTELSYYELDKYSSLMKGCYIFAKFELKYALGIETLYSYRPIVSLKTFDGYKKCSLDNEKKLLDFNLEDDSVSFERMISLPSGERDLFFDKVSKEELSLSVASEECDKFLQKNIVKEIKEYFLTKIPSLSRAAEEVRNEKVLSDFFDEELIGLILEFHKINDIKSSHSQVDIGTLVSEERIMTGSLGISTLINFLNSLGSFFDKGFIFDESQMRTELTVFKSEIKGFMRWYNSNPNDVTIREAKKIFGESQLGEYLSMAAISEAVYTKFTIGLNEMRESEIEDLFKKSGCKDYKDCFMKRRRRRNSRLKDSYDGVIQKYDALLKLSRQMTSSYDFRRIITPETDEGREILSLAHNSIIAPQLLGVASGIEGEKNLMSLLGEAILSDNSDGGFSERFVEEVVQHFLDKEESSKSFIAKWLFYDEGDFDWEKLQNTDSARKAVDYYARFIMLPKMLGHNQSKYLLNLRYTLFKKLIKQAQEENN